MTQTQTTADPTYVLGRSHAETERLIRQGMFYNPATRWALQQAGLQSDMKVLDVGSGAGDVALLAAELVGPRGSVVGVDQNPGVLEIARARAASAGHSHVTFMAGDVRTIDLDDDFDAVVGRLVLLYMGDPVETIRSMLRRLRPGGIVVFNEFNLTPPSFVFTPAMPLWQQAWDWLRMAFERAGVDLEIGSHLYRTYHAAGLPAPQMYLASPIGGGANWGGYEYMAATIRSALPLITTFGIATAAEIDVDTLADRLRAETVAHGGLIKPPELVSAWASKPLSSTATHHLL